MKIKKRKKRVEEKSRSERSLRLSFMGPGTVSSITPAHFSPPFCLVGMSITISLSLSLSLFPYLWREDIINTLISFSQLLLQLNTKPKKQKTNRKTNFSITLFAFLQYIHAHFLNLLLSLLLLLLL